MVHDKASAPGSPLPDKIVRTNEWIDREHNQEKWPAVRAVIENRIAQGETSLTRVLSQLKDWLWGDRASLETREMCLNGQLASVPSGAAGPLEDAIIYAALRNICREDASTYIDLGSGWGWRLLDMWTTGMIGVDARMYSMEYTRVGRECNELLLGLAPEVPMTVHPFDFYNPDYEPLPRGLGRIAAFSVYSIYHVPALKPDMFVQLLNMAEDIDCVLLEPIGFQIRDDEDGIGSSLAHAQRNDFNKNLWSVLKELEASGGIEIVEAVPDIVGRNPKNALSMVHWRKST